MSLKEFELDFPHEKTYQDWANFVREKGEKHRKLIKETASPFFWGSILLTFGMAIFMSLSISPTYSKIEAINVSSVSDLFATNPEFATSVIVFGASAFCTFIFAMGLISAKIFIRSSNKALRKKIIREIQYKKNRSRYLIHPDETIRLLTRYTFYA